MHEHLNKDDACDRLLGPLVRINPMLFFPLFVLQNNVLSFLVARMHTGSTPQLGDLLLTFVSCGTPGALTSRRGREKRKRKGKSHAKKCTADKINETRMHIHELRDEEHVSKREHAQ